MPAPPEPDATEPTTCRPEEVGSSIPPALARNPHYRIEREIGRGGMGVVYLAHNTILDRPEVLKVIGHDLLDRPGASERFLREMRSAAKLNHPNVVAAYTALSDGTFLALAMEFVPGEDLSKLVRRVGPLGVQQACFYVGQVAAGLQHAHEHGMVHRDIKPSNLIVSTAGKRPVVKILDFGLAKAAETSGERGLTASGAMLGTPEYMSPEQALHAATADIRSDIYSLGCTLYFLLAADTPYPAPNIYAMMHAHQTSPPPDPSKFRKDVPDELVEVVAKMMAKLPIDRYQTPVQVAKALMPFFKTGLTTELPAVNAKIGPAQMPTTQPRVMVAEVIDESTASGESARSVEPDSETEPPKDKTPVVDRLPARSYQIDADQFGTRKRTADKQSASSRRRQRGRRIATRYWVGVPAVLIAATLAYNYIPGLREGRFPWIGSGYSDDKVIANSDLLSWEGDTSDWKRVEDGYVSRKEGRGAGNRYIYTSVRKANYDVSFEVKLDRGIGVAGFHVRSEMSRSNVKGPQLGFGDKIWGDLRLFSDDQTPASGKFSVLQLGYSTDSIRQSDYHTIRIQVRDANVKFWINSLPQRSWTGTMTTPLGQVGFYLDERLSPAELTVRNFSITSPNRSP